MSRNVRIVITLVLTGLAAAGAWGTNAAIGWFAAPPEAPPEVSGAPVVANTASPGAASARPTMARALTEEQYLDGIMGRNVFDPAMIEAWAARKPKAGGTVSVADLKAHLLAVMVATPEEYSSALISEESSPDLPGAYSIGDTFHDREVVEIAVDRVGLRKEGGDVEYLMLEGGDLPQSFGSDDSTASSDATGDVSPLGDNKFAVSRDLFDKNINDLEGISRMGRALLHRGPDGEFDGYRLSAIRRNTLADQLGIKNGDIIHSVNGQPLNSVQSAMNAYNTMRTESNFCFEISRRGSPTELCYEVR
ncbi:MAG: type II secretion system protein GspC [Myxococcota bacterium]